MATAKWDEEHETVPDVDHAELLRVLTVERFRVWRPPARVPDHAAPQHHPRNQGAVVSALNAANVRGQVHDASKSNSPGRAR